jgi:hypothetical protein
MLEAFFALHGIPVGPILFLRDWGLSLSHPLPRASRGHKLNLIREMLELYSDLPFVLIGDSGQHDPEIYTQVVREHPRRVAAVFIRNVSHDSSRTAAIEALAQEVLEAGSSLLLAADSVAMAEHAATLGLVPHGAIVKVADERQAESGRRGAGETRVVRRHTREETQRAVARHELEQAMEGPEDEPPNTLVEAEADRDPVRDRDRDRDRE